MRSFWFVIAALMTAWSPAMADEGPRANHAYVRPGRGTELPRHGPIVVTGSGAVAREMIVGRDAAAELIAGDERVGLIPIAQGPVTLTPGVDGPTSWQVVYVPKHPLDDGREYRLVTRSDALDDRLRAARWKASGAIDPDFTERVTAFVDELAPGRIVDPTEPTPMRISAGRAYSLDRIEFEPSRPTRAETVVHSAVAGVVIVAVALAFAGMLLLLFRPRRLTWRGGPQLTRAQARAILGRL